MADYLVLTEFVPGTKAKAQEINANFTTLKDAINTKAAAEGDNAQVFSVANATEGEHAVSKTQLDGEVVKINSEIDGRINRFCLRSGNLAAGEADLLSYLGTSLSFKIGGSYPSLVFVTANGTRETVSSLADITGLSTNGTYSVLKELGAANAVATSSNVTQGKSFPTSPSNGDYHCLTATGLQTYKRVDGAWVERQYVLIGTVTVAANVISSVSTRPYVQNGYEVTIPTLNYMSGYRFPNYANKVSKSLNTLYTAETDGWLHHCSTASDVQNEMVVHIDGAIVYRTTYAYANDATHTDGGLFPISKGQTYQFYSTMTSNLACSFIPAKGAI